MSGYALNGIGVDSDRTVSTNALGLTLPTAKKTRHMILRVDTAAIRYCDDGTTATSSVGIRLEPGSYLVWMNPEIDYRSRIEQFSMIRDDSSDAVINAAFYE